ncbi:M56 family metallopeptidase [Carboxylicivirga taeanensis]|uniref:M56 family metallopeptidase n=1 Tax=Carboxylicivirga taeanensis TaxID=1416875 RepID=UPI003F6DD051
MTRFLIYLFESGLCLSLFYGGYILFFRKETYFTFNRIYLMLSMVLALILPLTSVQFSFDSADYLGTTLSKITEFRNYYEELILMTEPAFQVGGRDVVNGSDATVQQPILHNTGGEGSLSLSWSSFIFYVYIGGLLFFTIRLLVLMFNIYRIIRRNRVIDYKGLSVVLINEDVPSFSFLKWVFINKEALQSEEFEQVIAHEKVHVQHKHTVDLLLAHIITIFQWFNPLTWRIQKSIKTCHEYIADRQVIDQGHALFDYQSLLLSQLISIRSVELVNNFNLLSIKKRIAMMNKIKSGLIGQLKALLVIPMLTMAFFFFANMTGKALITEADHVSHSILDPIPKMETLPLQLVVEQDEAAVGEAPAVTEEEAIKTSEKEALEALVGHYQVNLRAEPLKKNQPLISVPEARSVKVYDETYVLSKLVLFGSDFWIDGEKVQLDNSTALLSKVAQRPGNTNKKSILLKIDKSTPMKNVDVVKDALRINDLLKIGYEAKAKPESEVNSRSTALFNLLPPKEAKMLTKEEAFFNGIEVFSFNASSEAELQKIAKRLKNHIESSKKYVILYEYRNSTTYDEYIQALDMVYSTVWKLRKQHAFRSGIDYETMTKEQEIQFRKQFPLTLTMRNVDEE